MLFKTPYLGWTSRVSRVYLLGTVLIAVQLDSGTTGLMALPMLYLIHHIGLRSMYIEIDGHRYTPA